MMNLDYDGFLPVQNKPMDVQGMYYKNQRILFVGEGDFSFSLSLATQFGNANNIVATSFDSREDLQKKYHMNAIENINNLNQRGAQVFYSVNARNMATKNGSLPLFGPEKSFYDVINFNFPHAGFFGFEWEVKVIRRHKKLMRHFFTNAAFMLSPGGLVYVSHKCGFPYDDWNLEELANMNGFELIGSTPFRSSNFPGYTNRRGAGKYAGETFELAKAAIYIFAIRCSFWIANIKADPLQSHNKDNVLLQTFSTLRSFKEKAIKNGWAPSKTPLHHLIAAEVARLETLKLGKKQRKLKSLKLMLEVMHLVVETPTFAIHRITSFQATSSYKKTMQDWREIQRLALEVLEPEAFEEAQNIKLEKLGVGAPKDGEGHTLLPELCAEQNMCDSTKDGCPYEQQCEVQVQEVLEIHVSDEAPLESEGKENEDSLCAFVLETQMRGPTDEDVMAPENTVLIGCLKIEESNHMSIIDQEDMYFQLEYQSSDEDQSDMPDLEAFSVYELSSGDMEDNVEEDVLLESNYSLDKRMSNWISKYIFSCFGTTDSFKEIDST